MKAADGATYAPDPIPQPVVAPGEFSFSAIGLDHGHIYGMCEGLVGAGAMLKSVYDPDPAKVAEFLERFPGTPVAQSEAEVLGDPEVQLVASAAVPSDRAGLGIRVMESGKDYFADKPPMTSLAQSAEAREATQRTGMKYAMYFGERVHVEAAVLAGQLIRDGAIGRVLQVICMGPHRLNAPSRPDWFYQRDKYGGILCDIGSHNCEQILFFTGSSDAQVVNSSIANYSHPEYPGLDDFGDANLVTDTGASGYFRVDWFTPDGLSTWGDGRTFILGTDGYMELRKYVDVATDRGPGQLYLVDSKGERNINAEGRVGYPFFGELILDCLNRTEKAMPQEHAFKAAELALVAQERARVLTPDTIRTTTSSGRLA